MKFSLFANIHKDSNREFLKKVAGFIESSGSTVIACETVTKGGPFDKSILKDTDIIITLGGDGTLLDIAQKTKNMNIPLVGINLGSIGFLTQIEKNNYEEMLKYIFEGQYDISNRMMLTAQVTRNKTVINTVDVLNDIVVTRRSTGDTVAISAHINGSHIDTYDGDGVIVSTPTGSTGYQMSAGGPVSDPEADVILLTPICPHMMHRQSYVIKSDGCIQLKVEESERFNCHMSYDGISTDIRGSDIITVYKSDSFTPFLKLQKNPFYENLRNKIYFRGN